MPAQQGGIHESFDRGFGACVDAGHRDSRRAIGSVHEAGVTMGHWDFASRDVQANKKIFVAMGGPPIAGGNETVLFPERWG